jgi:hypothetical protein
MLVSIATKRPVKALAYLGSKGKALQERPKPGIIAATAWSRREISSLTSSAASVQNQRPRP